METGDYHAVDITSATLCFLQLALSGIMLGFGVSYQDDCKNGATDYLVTGSAVIIVANIFPFITAIVIVFAGCECFVTKTFLCVQSALPLVRGERKLFTSRTGMTPKFLEHEWKLYFVTKCLSVLVSILTQFFLFELTKYSQI